MSPERERWAKALVVKRLHGDQPPRFIAERVRALALSGDEGEYLVARAGDYVSLSDAGRSVITDMLTSVLRYQRELLGWAGH